MSEIIPPPNYSDSESILRAKEAWQLAERGDSEAVSDLISALNDSDSYVRSTAAKALGKIGNPKALSTLIVALNDSDSYVISRAAVALGNIGNPEAVSALISALNDSDSYVISKAAVALGNIDDSEILKQLIRNWTINIYDRDIFVIARKLAVRYSQENLPFIPVYPHLVRFSYSPILATLIRFK